MPQHRIIRSHLIISLSILFACLVPQASWALILNNEDGITAPVSLGGHLSLLRDPTGELTIDDIESGGPNIRFEPIPSMLTEGYRKGAIWVRFSLSAPSASSQWLLEVERPLIEHVILYAPDESGRLTVSPEGGEGGARAYPALFPISVPSAERQYYIRFESMTSITTSLRVWQKQGYEANRRTDDWIIGIVVGAVGAMICANLLYAARLRDSLYLLYAAVLVESGMLAIFHLGYASELLYLLAPQQIHRIWGVVVCLYSIVMVLFLGRLFEFHRHWIWGWYIVQGVALLNGVALIFSIAGYYGDVGFFVSRLQQLSHIFISFFVIYLLFFKKQKQYIMPAIAFASVIGIILVMQAQYTGVNILLIDSSLSRLFVAGTLIHLVLLSAAVAKRAQLAERGLSEEKDRVIAMSRSAEQNLAFKVQEKTAELAEKNASLNAEIDRRHLLEMKLMQSLNSVNDALAQQGEFIALVSHEFRGPLGVIAASAHNLSFSIDKNASATTLRIAKIRQAVKKMSMLIENVLASDQITAGSTSLSKTEMLDLNEILLIAKTGLDDDAAKRVEFVPGEEAVLEGDRNLLEILLQNLIQNALKYSTKNNPVTVQLSVDEDTAFVDVIDRGIGVAPDDRERIFQKYYRAAGQRVNGSGLGLYISREIARQHGGNLVLTASDPRGSAFRLSLPLKRRDLDNPVPEDSALSDQSKRQT